MRNHAAGVTEGAVSGFKKGGAGFLGKRIFPEKEKGNCERSEQKICAQECKKNWPPP